MRKRGKGMASHCLTSYQHYVESAEQKNAKINGLEGQTVQNKE
jgi:hypothetical protein